MPERLPPDVLIRLQSLTAEGRRDIENHLFPRRTRAIALWLASMRAIGAVGLGIFTAGIAIFLVVVVLNLVFHYSPT